MRHSTLMLPLAALLIAVTTTMSTAQPGPQPVLVNAVRKEMVLDHHLVTGEIRAVRNSSLAAREPGIVIDMPVREGQILAARAVIARLDDTRLQLQLAAIEVAGQLAQATLAERKTQLAQAERDLKVLTGLSKSEATNPKEVADAGTAMRAARARVQQAGFQVSETSKRAALLRQRIADQTIRAPFKGAVVTRHKEIGEWVGEGEAVVDLVSTDEVEAWVAVPQRYHAAIHQQVVVQKKVAISLILSATGRRLVTTDIRMIPMVDKKARMFPLVARLKSTTGLLAPGMSVKAWVPTGQRTERFTVAKSAILRGDAGSYIYVARGGSDQKPAMTAAVQVKTLFATQDRVVVRATGLHEGDLAIVEGNERLFPMMPVIPKQNKGN